MGVGTGVVTVQAGDELFVVGKITDIFGDEWDFCGVFSDKEKAEAVCTTDKHFVAPARLDDLSLVDRPDGSQWPGGYFPKIGNVLDDIPALPTAGSKPE